jgi:uncharacterized protein (TIGR03086 family)
MTDLVELHRRALDATGRVVAHIAPAQGTAPTPCEGWDVTALLNHVVSGNWWAAELVSGKTINEVGTALDGDVLGDDMTGAYQASAATAAAAFARPGALDAPCAVSYGPVPGAVYAGHRIVDVLIHGWDLAVATGQDATLDPELVAGCKEIIDPQIDLLRASGMFGEAGEVSADADAQARLLSLLGRREGT